MKGQKETGILTGTHTNAQLKKVVAARRERERREAALQERASRGGK